MYNGRTSAVCAVKLEFHGSITFPGHRHARHTRHPREDATRVSRVLAVSGDFHVQLVTRLSDWSTGGLLRCIVLPVCPCVVSFSKFHDPDTHDLLRTSS